MMTMPEEKLHDFLDRMFSKSDPMRQQVPLADGDEPYEWHCGLLAHPGYRWEYDRELRARLRPATGAMGGGPQVR